MSVIIEGMDMPESCNFCDMHNYHFCDLLGYNIECALDNGIKPADCPIVAELPDEHLDLSESIQIMQDIKRELLPYVQSVHKEAIIKNLNAMVDKLVDDTEYQDALYHLEKLMELQQPCEDCISRAEALDILDDFYEDIENGQILAYPNARVKMSVLPSIQPTRAKGKWIGTKQIAFGEWQECQVPLKNGCTTNNCHCSECGEWLVGSDEYSCFGNYCPNCGADMRESEVKNADSN